MIDILDRVSSAVKKVGDREESDRGEHTRDPGSEVKYCTPYIKCTSKYFVVKLKK